MSMKVCKVCGSGYSFCPGCVKDMNKPRWMSSFDKEECKKLFDVLVKNSSGEVSDKDALDEVRSLHVNVSSPSIISHIERLKASTKNAPQTIIAEEKKEEIKEEEPLEEKEEESFADKGFFISNGKNKEKAKESAKSIYAALEKINKREEEADSK